MTDLLVSSLMADGGLENALHLTFRKEVQEAESKARPLVEDFCTNTRYIY